MESYSLKCTLPCKEAKIASLGIKKGFLFLFFTLSSGTVFGNTALDAVHVLRREKGAEAVKAVSEIVGEQGSPHPSKWTILLNDPQSRSGVREVVISQKKIISDRTPISQFSGVGSLPVLDIETLYCNSSDAFRIANSQAAQLGVGFHWLDYRLTQGNKGAIWKVHLSDYMGVSVGNIFISAETGAVLQPLKLDSRMLSRSEWVENGGLIGHVNMAAQGALKTTKKTVRKTVKSTEKTAIKVKEKTLNVVGDTQEWLTGKRTIGAYSE